jgi:hypothetical protein
VVKRIVRRDCDVKVGSADVCVVVVVYAGCEVVVCISCVADDNDRVLVVVCVVASADPSSSVAGCDADVESPDATSAVVERCCVYGVDAV